MQDKSSQMKKSMVWLMFVTIIFKGAGFINRTLIVAYFGATHHTDAFYTATGFIEGVGFILLASASTGIINLYISEKCSRDGNADSFICNCLLLFLTCLVIGMVLIFFHADVISRLLAPGWEGERESLLFYIKVSAVILPFQGIIIVLGAVLQAENDFLPVKSTGMISSVVSILVVVLFHAGIGEYTLILSFVVSYILNALLIVICSKKYLKFPKRKLRKDPRMKQLIVITSPLILGSAAHEINLMVDKIVATKIEVGAVTALSCATVLYMFVEGIFIQNVAMVLYPNLARRAEKKQYGQLSEKVRESLMLLTAILLPITILSLLFSNGIVSIAYGRGDFDQNAVSMTARALEGYVIGFLPLAFRDVLLKVCYAFQDTVSSMRIGILAVCINIALDIVLGRYVGMIGLTLSTSIANLVSVLLLYLVVKKKKVRLLEHGMFQQGGKLVVSNLLCTGMAVFLKERNANFFLAAIVFFSIYAGLLYVLDFSSLRHNVKKLLKKEKAE